MCISKRLEQLVHSNLYRSRRAFALAAGINEVTLSDNLRKGTEPRYSTLAAILKANPQVSAEWLMRGEGNMLRTGEQPENVMQVDKPTRTAGGSGVAEGSNSENADSTIVELLRKEVASLQEQLKEKGEQLKVKDEQIASLLAILSK